MLKQIEKLTGGKAYYVGGYVRDKVLGLDPKDRDIEVYNVNYQDLVSALSTLGKLDVVGKSFGVIKLKVDNIEYDISLPRRENKIGVGHTGFEVNFDPEMSTYEACLRRDFTMNAMMLNSEDTLYDPFGGSVDLRIKLLVPTSNKFVEDPLRILRGMQFAARFKLNATKKLREYSIICAQEFYTLSPDRIWGEWKKFAEKGVDHRCGIKFLYDSGWYNFFSINQDIFRLLTLNVFGNIVSENKLLAFFTYLCTHLQNPTLFLQSINMPEYLVKDVLSLRKYSTCDLNTQELVNCANNEVSSLEVLLDVRRCLNINDDFTRKHAINLNGKIPCLINGDDLIQLGFKPNPIFKKILEDVLEQQIFCKIKSKDAAMFYVFNKYLKELV